ncbi:MAG: WYL domain-containing transcriptional regulator [Clostridiaceae bacterium]
MSDPRTRLLRTRAYLMEQSDERHFVSAAELIAHLECEGLAADRRTVISDIALLRRSGLPIAQKKTRPSGYYLESRMFEPAEIQLLIDLLHSSRLLTREHGDALSQKLASLLGKYEAEKLRRETSRSARTTAGDERAYGNLKRVYEALADGRKLSFHYCQYTQDKTLVSRRNGGTYVVNPCLTLFSGGNCYLLADHPLHEGLAHYRVDKMTDICLLDEPRAPLDPAFDPAQYAKTVFSMYPGEPKWVRLAFDKSLIGAVIDRFGADAPIAELDETTCSVSAPVRVSPPFFGWVFQFGGGVRILSPDDVRERMALLVEAAKRAAGNESLPGRSV